MQQKFVWECEYVTKKKGWLKQNSLKVVLQIKTEGGKQKSLRVKQTKLFVLRVVNKDKGTEKSVTVLWTKTKSTNKTVWECYRQKN